jgi:hypothetical protein
VAFVRLCEIYCVSRGESPLSPYRIKSVGHVTFFGAYDSPATSDVTLKNQTNITGKRKDTKVMTFEIDDKEGNKKRTFNIRGGGGDLHLTLL